MEMESKVKPFREKFVRENPEVEKWLVEKARRSKYTRKVYEHIIYHYFQWLKSKRGFADAKQLLDDYKALKKESREYEHIDIAKEFLFNGKLGTQSYVYRNQVWRTIRSFYESNRCSLPKEKIDLTISEVDEKRLREKTGLEPMRLEDVKKLIGPAKIKYKTVILVLLQSGMRVGEFCEQFNTDEAKNVLKQLREGKCPIKINLIASRKERPQYFTFIGRDAVDALKEFLNVRGEVKEGEPIFLTQMGKPITGKLIDKQVQVLKRQTGLVKKDFTPHTLRDIFKTECSHQGVKEAISEFFIGHALDKLGYNQLDKLYPRDFEIEYAKVEGAFNIISFKAGLVTRLDRLRQQLEDWGYKPDEILREEGVRKLASARKAIKHGGPRVWQFPYEWTEKEKEEILQEFIQDILERRGTEHNGGKPFESRIISEDELTGYLDEGWDLVKELSNGKIVVRRRLE